MGGLRARRERGRGAGRDVRGGRRTHRRLLALQLERSTGTGQFLPHDGATPAIGSVGTVERVPEERVEVIAPARLRGQRARGDACGASLRGTRVRRLRAGADARRRRHRAGSARLPAPEPLSAFVSRVHARAARRRRGECGPPVTPTRRCRGWRCAGERVTRCSTPSRARTCRPTSPPTCVIIPADEHRRASDVALIDVAHWASELPWCAQAADV